MVLIQGSNVFVLRPHHARYLHVIDVEAITFYSESDIKPIIVNMVKWVRASFGDARKRYGIGRKPILVILSVIGKDILGHFSLLGDFGKHFLILVIFVKNFKPTTISSHFRKQVEVFT